MSSSQNTHTNLPVQLTSFVGREQELAEAGQKLSSVRLLTLTGPGGAGKTRLALRLASQASGSLRDGVWWVDLAPVSDPVFVPLLIAGVIEAPRAPDQPAEDALLRFLASKELLLVLDNCEHLVDGCARLASQILSQAPGVHILATSREPLAVDGERVYPLYGLDLPPYREEEMVAEQAWMRYSAVRLFVERARAVHPRFDITQENAPQIIQICRRLDGLPLALELASAHTSVLSLHEIAARLDDRFALLVSRQRIGPDPRHRTLRAAVDWSYDLLTPPQQALLRRLSVFAGGCSLSAVEVVCAGDGLEPGQILDVLSSLVRQSLVVAHTYQRDEARYLLLETIREYGHEKLVITGERTVVRDRHLDWFLKLSQDMDQKLRGQNQRLVKDRLDLEYDNARAALSWAVESGDFGPARVDAGLRVTVHLYQFWRIRGSLEEGLSWCEKLFARANERVSPAVRLSALAYASLMAGLIGRVPDQMRYAEQAVATAESADAEGKPALAFALGALGYAARKVEDYPRSYSLGLREIELLREAGDAYALGLGLSINSFTAMSIGRYDQARAMLEESLPLLRDTGDPYRIAMALNFSGDLARCEQDFTRAALAYEESISLLREIGASGDLASALSNLGHTRLRLGDAGQAYALIEESLSIHQRQDNKPGVAECLLGFAALLIEAGMPVAGARLLAAAEAHGGKHITSEWAATRQAYEHSLEQARAALNPPDLEAAWDAGQRLSQVEAAAFAQESALRISETMRISMAQKAVETHPTHQPPDSLTPRESEVAALIADAKSNDEIAAVLFLSKRTVESHIASIRAKLGFTERAQIVRWVIDGELVRNIRD